jgi:AsmA protein
MPLTRRYARIPAAIALIAVAAVALLWAGARTPYVRVLVAGAVTDVTGLPARVDRLRLGFLPSPRLDIRGLTVAQPPDFGDEPLLEVGRIEVELPWRRIVGATDRINALTVTNATARLRISADGASNWSRLSPETAATAAPAEPARWSIGALVLEGGAIDYRDAATGAHGQLTAITLEATDVAPGAAFPLELRLGGIAGASTLHFALKGEVRMDPDAGRHEASAIAFRGWLGGDPLPLAGAELRGTLRQASYENNTGVATFAGGQFRFAEIPGRFDGTLALGGPALVADFAVVTEAFAPRAPAIIFGRALPVTADPSAFESLQVALRARMTDGEIALDPLSGRLDDTNFEGRVVPSRRLVRASLDAIDFNRYLPPPAAKTASGGGSKGNSKEATLEALASELAGLDLDAELRIADARIGDARVRDAVIRITPDSEATR